MLIFTGGSFLKIRVSYFWRRGTKCHLFERMLIAYFYNYYVDMLIVTIGMLQFQGVFSGSHANSTCLRLHQ